MTQEFKDKFYDNSSETGRHTYKSFRTKKVYAIEPIDKSGRPADWGSYNPSTGNIENKKGAGKFTGSIHPDDSLITEENGFTNIQMLDPGTSPYSAIELIDSQYPTVE